eukprot:XP_001707154.1 Hypothetical protein GL50803_21371 [Giardia lamblia ATCC 50803]
MRVIIPGKPLACSPAETQNPKSEVGCRLLLTGKIYASFPEAIEGATEGLEPVMAPITAHWPGWTHTWPM